MLRGRNVVVTFVSRCHYNDSRMISIRIGNHSSIRALSICMVFLLLYGNRKHEMAVPMVEYMSFHPVQWPSYNINADWVQAYNCLPETKL